MTAMRSLQSQDAFRLAPPTAQKRLRFDEGMVMDALRVWDCVALVGTGLIAGAIPVTAGDIKTGLARLLITVALAPHALAMARAYPKDFTLRLRDLISIGLALLFVTGCVAIIPAAADLGSSTELSQLASWLAYAFAGLATTRAILLMKIHKWRHNGQLARNVIVIGTPDLTWTTCQHLRLHTETPLRVVGAFHVPAVQPRELADSTLEADLFKIVHDQAVDQVILALPWNSATLLASWSRFLRNLPVDALICPPLPIGGEADAWSAATSGLPGVSVAKRPLAGWCWITKALEDRLIAALLLLACAPLMLMIALAVRLDSPGPILFQQKRHGFSGKVIDVLKFRTMHAAAAQDGIGDVTQATRTDARVTRVGRWLRRTSLDELPQLINVLLGHMSIVGPRPHAVAHNNKYARTIDAYLSRHRVKPGITGWAQVNGARGETNTVDKMMRRVNLDLFYIEHWSVIFDLYILLRTPLAVLLQRNAY